MKLIRNENLPILYSVLVLCIILGLLCYSSIKFTNNIEAESKPLTVNIYTNRISTSEGLGIRTIVDSYSVITTGNCNRMPIVKSYTTLTGTINTFTYIDCF